MDWIAFFGCIKHEFYDEVNEVLLSYSHEGYIISREITMAGS